MNGSQIDLDHFKQGHRFVVFASPGKRACYTDEAHEAAAEANSLGKNAFAMKLFDRGRRLERLGSSPGEHVADALRGKPGDELVRDNPAAPKPFQHWRVTGTTQAADHGTYARATHYDVISPEGKRGSLVPTHGVYRFVEQLAFFEPMEGFALTAEARRKPEPKRAPEPEQMGFRFNPGKPKNTLNTPGLFHTQTAILDLPGVLAPIVRGLPVRARPAGVSAPLEGHGGRVLTGKPRVAEDGQVVVRAKDQRTGKLVEIPIPPGATDWRVDLASPPREMRGPLVPAPEAIAPGSVRRGVSIYPLGTRRDEDGNPVGEARMPTGDSIEYAWRVARLQDLKISHDPWALTVNDDYPQVLQPRDRSRSSYADQINRLVREFDPQLLTWSATAADGAPIVGPDMVVESGNGRMMALSRIYRDGGAKADAYKATIAAWAAHLGMPADQVERIADMSDPVLVRLRLTDVDRAEFAREANVSGQQGMAAAEQAISDAAALTPALVGKLDPAADLSAGANQGFVSAFIDQVAGRQSRGTMADARGKLSLAGENRIRYALFAFAYGPASHSLLPEIAEFRDSDLTAFLRGMMMAAQPMARLQADIADGIYDSGYSVGGSVSEAAHFVAAARKADQKVWQRFAQVSMFPPTEAAHCWLFAGFPKGERTSGPTLTAALLRYALEVQQHPAGQMSFLDEAPAALDLIGQAVAAVVADGDPPTGAAEVEIGKRIPAAVASALPANWGAFLPVVAVLPAKVADPPPKSEAVDTDADAIPQSTAVVADEPLSLPDPVESVEVTADKKLRWPYLAAVTKASWTASAAQLLEAFDAFTARLPEIEAALTAAWRKTGLRSADKIRSIVSDLIDRVMFRFSPAADGMVSYSMDVFGQPGEYKKAKIAGHRKAVASQTDEKLATWRESVVKERAEFEDPLSLPHIENIIKTKGIEALTPEQLAIHDADAVARSHAYRERNAAQRAIVRPVTTLEGATVVEGWHTKHNRALWVVVLPARIGPDEFKALAGKARQLGGQWQNNARFTGGKTPSGFNFDTADGAARFASLVGGEAVSTEEDWQEAQESSREAGAAHLREVAEDMIARAQEALGRDRMTNTRRRADMAAGVIADAEALKSLGETTLRVADAVAANNPALAGIRHVTQVSELRQTLRTATWAWARANDADRPDITDPRILPFVRYPWPEIWHQDLRRLAEKMAVKSGSKRFGAKLLKFLNAAKEERSTFKNHESIEEIADAARNFKSYGLSRWDVANMREAILRYMRLWSANIRGDSELREACRAFAALYRAPAGESEIAKATRDLVGRNIPGFFPTPRPVIDRMIAAADLSAGQSVLEPSAGKGDIAEAIREADPEVKVEVVESAHSLRQILELKGFAIVGDDFLEFNGGPYDRILMNPPFESGADIDHVRHAFNLLAPGGRLVAIMSEGPFFRSDRKAEAFRQWLESVDGHSEKLPEGSFAGKDAFRQTGVATRLVTIEKDTP